MENSALIHFYIVLTPSILSNELTKTPWDLLYVYIPLSIFPCGIYSVHHSPHCPPACFHLQESSVMQSGLPLLGTWHHTFY